MSALRKENARRTDALASLEVALLDVALANGGRPDGAPHGLTLLEVTLLDVTASDRGRVDGAAWQGQQATKTTRDARTPWRASRSRSSTSRSPTGADQTGRHMA